MSPASLGPHQHVSAHTGLKSLMYNKALIGRAAFVSRETAGDGSGKGSADPQ